MLTTIFVFTCLSFSAVYPLAFWLVRGHPINEGFRKFNLGLTNLIGGFGLVLLIFMNVPLSVKALALLWKASLISVSAYSWKKEEINTWLMSFPSVLGIMACAAFQKEFISVNLESLAVVVLGGIILCVSLFAMILGHWYLNVAGLPIAHLRKTTQAFLFFLIIRGLWDAVSLVTKKIIHGGDSILIYQFLARVDGFLLSIALFFGTLLPIILMYFVLETLKVKSTQSATGLLYIAVIAVLMGDLTYKYYLFHFSLFL